MTAEYIAKCANACAKIYRTNDPEAIFHHRGAKIRTALPEGLRGMICVVDGECAVYAGICSSDSARSAEIARLLGHAVLHREELLSGMSFEDVYGSNTESVYDREASLFAAELLIPDDKIHELECFGYSDGQIAASFGPLKELVPFKLMSMNFRRQKASSTLGKCDVELFLKNEI